VFEWLIDFMAWSGHPSRCPAKPIEPFTLQRLSTLFILAHIHKNIFMQISSLFGCVRMLSVTQPIIASFIRLIGGQVKL
jgi:hypothetical protein